MNVLLVAALVLAAASGCSDTVRKVVMTTVDPYFHGPGIDVTAFKRGRQNQMGRYFDAVYYPMREKYVQYYNCCFGYVLRPVCIRLLRQIRGIQD